MGREKTLWEAVGAFLGMLWLRRVYETSTLEIQTHSSKTRPFDDIECSEHQPLKLEQKRSVMERSDTMRFL